jgi:taurine dioxygenase
MFEIEQISGHFGADVSGVDLAHPLAPEIVAKLDEALGTHKVLVFRDQHGVGPAEQVQVARCFGTHLDGPHPTWAHVEGWPEVAIVASEGTETRDGRNWHTDGATRDEIGYVSILRAVDVPPQGRDTVYADMEAAYDRLSEPMRAFLDGLTAEHSWGVQSPGAPPVRHPLVVVNPRSGRKAFYANRVYTRRIVELRDDESEALLELLFRQALFADFQLRVRWRPGTIVIWDNASTQHHGTVDYVSTRVLHRVMVSGGGVRRSISSRGSRMAPTGSRG